eukprot:12935832-Alexandrium_andersonii.AAC.1
MVQARSRCVDRSGYSVAQSVFGQTPRLPRSLLADDFLDPHDLALDAKTNHQRSREVRMAATMA